MKVSKGNSLAQTKRINRVGIKNCIFRNDVITRLEISKYLDLTLPTITTNIHEMIMEGMLQEVPIETKKSGIAGRKPTAIRFREDYACAIGVELGPYATMLVVADALGTIICHRVLERAADDYKEMLAFLTAQIQEILPKKGKVLGVGVGLPGFIETDTGIIRTTFRENWAWKNLAVDLKERLHIPVFIDNNVRLMALGYDMSMKNSHYDTFAYFYMSKGIACPLIIKNEILSGFTSGSGEIGENVVAFFEKEKKTFKTLDAVGSETAIFEICNRLIRSGKLILDEKKKKTPITTIDEVLQLQMSGEEKVIEIVNQAIEYMGVALSQVVNLINPGLVVVNAQIFTLEENRKQFKKCARKHFYGLNEDEVKIVFVPHEGTEGARGAAYYIIKKLLIEK